MLSTCFVFKASGSTGDLLGSGAERSEAQLQVNLGRQVKASSSFTHPRSKDGTISSISEVKELLPQTRTQNRTQAIRAGRAGACPAAAAPWSRSGPWRPGAAPPPLREPRGAGGSRSRPAPHTRPLKGGGKGKGKGKQSKNPREQNTGGFGAQGS